jgi:hypothetical protein
LQTRHQHKYYEIAIYKPKGNVGDIITGSCPSTIVLKRCECGDTFTLSLRGDWTLAHVRGKSDLDDAQESKISPKSA